MKRLLRLALYPLGKEGETVDRVRENDPTSCSNNTFGQAPGLETGYRERAQATARVKEEPGITALNFAYRVPWLWAGSRERHDE